MNYSEAIKYLYQQAPMFQHHGKKAYKSGLHTSELLDAHFGHAHRNYQTIHVAGTNGKGSTTHLIAAVLQAAGYRVGLYTSPHLRDFSERIRVNGAPIDEQAVTDFVENNRSVIERLQPSFFEITTAFAFRYFADCNVDVAVVEAGLGGRLDCTNIITPQLSVITNISFDHTDILGDTLAAIAWEKAGIIKPDVRVVIGETHPETAPVFLARANECCAPVVFADVRQHDRALPSCGLGGWYQRRNIATAFTAIECLQELGWTITAEHIRTGFADVISLTNLNGRWQTLRLRPAVICDTAHNEAGIRLVVEQLLEQKFCRLRIVFGMVNDKKTAPVLALLPQNAIYYFTKASIPRALDEKMLQHLARPYSLYGETYHTVKEAVNAAISDASEDDLIFIGGSTYVVGEIF
ncbi:MAG: bifunctional folylpolyglutamate synthase/dihydrofolate synthase [Prevotellaceae bacterium]|jgi:dihydrofolate synthase/folylpolyglutamate synthase|nr:bifunctional folylpolyglutamate synthase/dihydrofolate synthase [Prevotellaceae bacterium]